MWNFLFPHCWKPTTPLTYSNSMYPWRLSLASVLSSRITQVPASSQSSTRLIAWFCAIPWCLLILSWVKIHPPQRISNSAKAEAVMPPHSLTRFLWKSQISLALFRESFSGFPFHQWVHYNTEAGLLVLPRPRGHGLTGLSHLTNEFKTWTSLVSHGN